MKDARKRRQVVDISYQKRDAIIESALSNYEAEHGPLGTIRHTVQVSSFGGTASSAFSTHLRYAGVDLPRTPGEFPFKRQRVPATAVDIPRGFKVIYLYKDPRNAVLSVFRRGAMEQHYKDMWGIQPPPDSAARLTSLETFIRAGWPVARLTSSSGSPLSRAIATSPLRLAFQRLCFLRFISTSNRVKISNSRCPINCRGNPLPTWERGLLNRMYEPLATWLEKLPPVLEVD